MSRPVRLRLLALLLAATSVSAACAGGSKERHAQEAAAQHVYAQPLEQVWEQARLLLREQGYGVREAVGSFEMLTDTRDGNELSTLGVSHRRIFAKGVRTPDGRARVEFFRVEWMGTTIDDPDQSRRTKPKRSRDLELEWRLLQRVDPETARKLAGS